MRLVRVESTFLKLRVRTSRQLIWLACMETLLDDCATQDCVIVLGDIADELLVANACTFLENDVVSLDPLGLV